LTAPLHSSHSLVCGLRPSAEDGLKTKMPTTKVKKTKQMFVIVIRCLRLSSDVQQLKHKLKQLNRKVEASRLKTIKEQEDDDGEEQEKEEQESTNIHPASG
jgi:TolA-binding protein